MKAESQELPLANVTREAPPEPSVGSMLQAVIKGGITDQNVSVLEKMVAMKERSEQRQAEREYAVAFHHLQSEMPAISASSVVPDKNGNQRYRFAAYEDIMKAVRPLLIKHGFSITFDSEFKDARMIVTCRLMHVGGHSKDTTSMVRVGQGPYGASDTQADGAAQTYAKRYALCAALNIIIEHDTDGATDVKNDGQPITYEQAETLREMVKEAKADEKRFLKYAGSDSFETIGTNRYAALFAELQTRLGK